MESRSSLPLLDCSNPLQASIARARAAQRAYYRRTDIQLALDQEEPMPENQTQEAASAAVTQAERDRLEYLRGEIQAERISYAEIAELQAMADKIAPGDVELLEWAGVPEHSA